MENLWMKPQIEVVSVSSECTAYSGIEEGNISI
jgi:hypothetical protein